MWERYFGSSNSKSLYKDGNVGKTKESKNSASVKNCEDDNIPVQSLLST